jgi:hypothetical protein
MSADGEGMARGEASCAAPLLRRRHGVSLDQKKLNEATRVSES